MEDKKQKKEDECVCPTCNGTGKVNVNVVNGSAYQSYTVCSTQSYPYYEWNIENVDTKEDTERVLETKDPKKS